MMDNKPKSPPFQPPAAGQGPTVDDVLLTTDLGGPDQVRAEAVIQSLSEVVKNPSLKGDPSELPNKQLIFRGLAMMDAKIKTAQKRLDEKQTEVGEATRQEGEERERANAAAVEVEKRDEEERLRKESEIQREEESAQESALQTLVNERQPDFDARAEQLQIAFTSQVRSARLDEEKKLREGMDEQIISLADGFDKEIAKARKDVARVVQQTKKTEAKIASVEADYQAKVKQSDKKSKHRGPPKTQDIVASILSQNQMRASEAHMALFVYVTGDESRPASLDALKDVQDPKYGKSSEEWAHLTQQVTGFADALYSEPSEAPYFESNERSLAAIKPLVKEYVRDRRARLMARWTELAEEYDYRKTVYEQQQQKSQLEGKAKQKRSAVAVRHSILGKPGMPILESSGGRASTNPYRRARRGNEVRTEYEQEQIIAELAAKEAMEKKISFGGSKIPRQVGRVEKQFSATFFNTFTSQRVDLIEQEADLAISNVWSDMEKCIFLDRFMQHPKDFKKIASFLRNKTTRDCVEFYYDSKQSVPYKAALKEHIMRRKRRGDYAVWDATIEAALSAGAKIEVGTSEEKPLVFLLPETDHTFHTQDLHPLKREILDDMEIDEDAARAFGEQEDEEPRRPGRPRKRPRDALFLLDPEKRKYLRTPSPEHSALKHSPSRASLDETDITEGSNTDGGRASGMESGRDIDRSTPMRRAPQKWTNAEKRIFVDTLEKHGRNWSLLAEAVGTKSISQIKNFYYDYKKQAGRGHPEKEKKPKPIYQGRERKREDEVATPPPSYADSTPTTPGDAYNETPPPPSWALHQQQQQLLEQEALLRERAEAMSMQRSEATTPDSLSATERWVQAQHHSLLNQHQQSQTEEAARRLLQHHSHAQHQQILSNLFPWIGATHQVASAGSGLQDWADAQQLQQLLQLRHQSQQNPLAALGASSHLRSLALAGLGGGLNAGALELALAQQQQQQQHHHQQQQQQQSQVSDAAQVSLAQQLLAYQGSDTADTLALLQRAMSGHGYHGVGPGGGPAGPGRGDQPF